MADDREQRAKTTKDLPPNHPAQLFVKVDRLPRVPLEETEIDLGRTTPVPQLDAP